MAYTEAEWRVHLGTCRAIIVDLENTLSSYFATTAIPVGGDAAQAVELEAGQIADIQTAYESRVQIVIDLLTAGFA